VTSAVVLDRAAVEAAVSPERALEAVREAFVAHASGEWEMPPKVYVTNYPAGDFRAMPARGEGHALLKWVTSFPGNPPLGLPTVMGVVLVSSAADGRLVAALDAASDDRSAAAVALMVELAFDGIFERRYDAMRSWAARARIAASGGDE